jgi:peptidoglycan hydrolase-like protein with peptidoglycan-binding domain
VTVDGIFGPKTKSAVRAFQHAIGIVSDGIVGPLTWQALVSGMLAL